MLMVFGEFGMCFNNDNRIVKLETKEERNGVLEAVKGNALIPDFYVFTDGTVEYNNNKMIIQSSSIDHDSFMIASNPKSLFLFYYSLIVRTISHIADEKSNFVSLSTRFFPHIGRENYSTAAFIVCYLLMEVRFLVAAPTGLSLSFITLFEDKNDLFLLVVAVLFILFSNANISGYDIATDSAAAKVADSDASTFIMGSEEYQKFLDSIVPLRNLLLNYDHFETIVFQDKEMKFVNNIILEVRAMEKEAAMDKASKAEGWTEYISRVVQRKGVIDSIEFDMERLWGLKEGESMWTMSNEKLSLYPVVPYVKPQKLSSFLDMDVDKKSGVVEGDEGLKAVDEI